jgi:hypothetical protein
LSVDTEILLFNTADPFSSSQILREDACDSAPGRLFPEPPVFFLTNPSQ